MHILNRTLYFLFTVLFALAITACTQSPKNQEGEVATGEPQDTTTEAVNSEMATLRALASELEQGDDVALLGWTNDGKILAYRSFYLSDADTRHATISVEVVNIVSDEVLWNFKQTWEEGTGKEGATTAPTTGAEAWAIVAEEVSGYTAAYNIVPGEEPESHESYGNFPFGGDIVAYSAGVTVSEKDNSYKVVASSSADGEKTLVEKQRDPGDFSEVSVVGYFMNPQSDRIAIIVKESPPNPVIYYYVTGCSLKTGFKAVVN